MQQNDRYVFVGACIYKVMITHGHTCVVENTLRREERSCEVKKNVTWTRSLVEG